MHTLGGSLAMLLLPLFAPSACSMYKVLYKEAQRRNAALSRYNRLKVRLDAGRFDATSYAALASERSKHGMNAAAAAAAVARADAANGSQQRLAADTSTPRDTCVVAVPGSALLAVQRRSTGAHEWAASEEPELTPAPSKWRRASGEPPEGSRLNMIKSLWSLVTFQPVAAAAAAGGPPIRSDRHAQPADALSAAAAAAAAASSKYVSSPLAANRHGDDDDNDDDVEARRPEESAHRVLKRQLTRQRLSGRMLRWLVFFSVLLQHDEEVAILLAQRLDKVCYAVIFLLFNVCGAVIFVLPHRAG